MNFFSIVVLFFIISFVAKTIKAKNEQAQNGNVQRDSPYKGVNQDTYHPQSYVKPPVQAASAAGRNYTTPAEPIRRNPAKPIEILSKDIKQVTEKKEQSTVDYLSEKAEKEQQSQDLERYNAARERSASGNGIQAAERVIEGVSVPVDRRMIHCNYCGADNMIPGHSHEKYTCYFCREVL